MMKAPNSKGAVESQPDIESGFGAALYLHRVRRLRERAELVEDPDYWRRLNPELTISDHPFATRRTPYSVDGDLAEAHVRQIREDGYFHHSTPLIPPQELSRLRDAIARVVGAGFHAVFAWVYDEFYQLFDGLSGLLSPILEEDYLFVPERFYAWHIEPGARTAWPGPTPPHRDSLGPDRRDLTRELPTLVTVWIPLTDATPLNSCIYVVPANRDPDYNSRDRAFHPDRMSWQHIRAVPAAAGSILCWTTHLLHWGSHSSPHATTPRVSIATYFQSRHVPPYHESAFAVPSPITFHDRLRWIALAIDNPNVFEFPRKPKQS